jgi:hypothetical protein
MNVKLFQLEGAVLVIPHFIAPPPELLDCTSVSSDESSTLADIVVDTGHPGINLIRE